jgi:Domain of unknown function (DUF4157)/Annexin
MGQMSELISQRLRYRAKIQQKRSVISTYSQPNLAQKSIQGFGLSSSSTSQSIASFPSHDISRISLRPQAKLTVGQPGDIYEQEADNVAEQVMRMTVPETLEFSSAQTAQNSLQHKFTACENEGTEEIQRKPTLQKAADSNIEQPNNNIESQLSATQGGGSPLPDNVRGFMEPRFGADFGSVRVHTGCAAVQLSRNLGAQAFTYGNDIYFGTGKLPGNNDLTAHELTHVMQQTPIAQIQPRRVCEENGACYEELDPVTIEGNPNAPIELDPVTIEGNPNAPIELDPEQTANSQPNQQLDLAKINADADALFKAVDGWGTDEDTILKILASKTPAEIAAIKQVYTDHYARNLDKDLVSEMSGDDLKEAQAKLSGDKVQGAIEALNNSIGFFNDDEAKIEETLSALSPEDLKQMKLIAAKNPDVKAKLDNVLDHLDGNDKEVAEALLEGDKEKAAAARIAEAIQGLGTDEKAVYKYLEDKNPQEIEQIKKAYQEKTGRTLAADIEDDFSNAQKDQADALLAGDKAAAAAARIKEAAEGLGTDEKGIYDQLKGKSKQERDAIIKAYEEHYGKGSFDAMLADELSDDDLKQAQQYKNKGELDPGFALNLAMSSLGTDENLIKETLKDKSKEEIKAIREAYTKETGKDLDTELKSELDGRDDFEVEQMLEGKPQTSKEYYDQARERYKFERGKRSTWFSRGVMDASETIGMHSKSEMLEYQNQRLQEMFDKSGNLKPDFTQKDVERIAGYQETDATNYKDAKESVGNVVTIAVSALVTICTYGVASPWLAAVISGALAGGIIKYGMQGDAYGGEDIAIDAVVAIVASALKGFLADGTQFMTKLDDILKSLGEGAAKKAAQEALRGAVSADVLKEIFNDTQWRKGVEHYLLNVVTVAGVSAIKSAASGGMEDPLKSKSSLLFGTASGISEGIIDEGVSGIKGEYKGRIEDLLGRLAVAGVSKAVEEQAQTSASDLTLRLIAKQVVSATAANDDMSTAYHIIDKNTVYLSVEEKQKLVEMISEEALNNHNMSASKTTDKINNAPEVISEEQSQKTPKTSTIPKPEANITDPREVAENLPVPQTEDLTGKVVNTGKTESDSENDNSENKLPKSEEKSNLNKGEVVNVKEEVEKASSPEPSFLFRADDDYKMGNPVGFELDSEDAQQANIKSPLEHVLDKESGDTSIYVSFSTAIRMPGGGGAIKFTKKNKMLKVASEALKQLEAEGKIKIYTPEQVAELIRQNPKKKISKQANNVKAAMEKNGEILIEGQIPGEFIVPAK